MPVARTATMIVLCTALAGCGGFGARLNPFNWFKKSEPRGTVVVDESADPRPLVDAVLTLAVEPIPGGAIVRAIGQTPTQGWWQAELVPLPLDENGSLVYEFRLQPPATPADVNTPRSREVDVAIYISDYRLEAVREIVVQGAGNARVARR